MTHHQNTNNFLVLMILYMLMIVFPIISAVIPIRADIIFNVLYTTIVVFGVYVATTCKRDMIIGMILGSITLWVFWRHSAKVLETNALDIVETLASVLFFVFLGISVFRRLTSEVNLMTIFAAIIGYFILGTIGGQLCLIVDSLQPGAFQHVDNLHYSYAYYYFSFITLTTVGFGEMYPITDAARAITLMIGIAGQLYLTIVLGLIVGQYLSLRTPPHH